MKAVNSFKFVCLFVVALAFVAAGFQASATQQPQAQKQEQKKGEQKKGAPKQDPKPQDPKPDDVGTIKLDTQLVNLLFAVQDKQNRYINDLKQEDITLLEDGKPQQIFTFKKEFDLPLTMAILVDVSGSEQYVLPMLKDAGGRFVDAVIRKNKDTAAVVKFEGEATIMQGLTSNPARIRKGLEEIVYTAPPPSGVYGGATPGINPNSRQGGTSLYDAIVASCSDLLAKQPGRKTIILITDGVDTTSRMKIGDAINDALKAEVVIYAVGIGDPGFGINEGALKRICESTGGRAVWGAR